MAVAYDESSHGLLFFLSDGEKRPVADLYGVFRRPRNDKDRRTGDLARRWGGLAVGARAEPALGEVIEDEGRLVLSGLGGAADMLYVAPTTNEDIAHAVLPNGGGGCCAPGPDGLVLSVVSRRRAFVVHGLVADPIVAVDVVVNGEARSARMGENAFGLRVEDAPAAALEKLILHRDDGTTNELDVCIPTLPA